MKEKKSIYECPVCKGKLKFIAGQSVVCRKCAVEMEETSKGIITK
jgi:uncharacterized protein YbaR (Trm112 family)